MVSDDIEMEIPEDRSATKKPHPRFPQTLTKRHHAESQAAQTPGCLLLIMVEANSPILPWK
jgi:hypothetical protein